MAGTVRLVLMVEDDPAHAEAIRRAFEAGGAEVELQVVATLREFRSAVAARTPDLALMDVNLADGMAQEVLIWPPEAGAYPVVVMTSHGNEQMAVEVMRAGALDYVPKSAEAFANMPHTVRRALETWQLVHRHKHAKEAAAKIQRLLLETETIGKVGGWEFHTDTRKPTWTGMVYRTLELDPNCPPSLDEAINFYTPQCRPIIAAALRAVVERGEPFDLELEIFTAKGNLRDVHIIGRADPKNHRVYGFFQDVTERKQAEVRLRESEGRFHRLIESAPEAIFVQSQGRFVYVNAAAVKLFGASSSAELIGAEFMDRMAPEHRQAIRKRIARQMEAGEPVPPMDQEYLRMDGSRVPVETTAVAVRYEGAEAHMVFIRDITARRQAEAALQEAREQLIQSQKMDALGQLAGGMAHDFRNQLTVIKGLGEMLLRRSLVKEQGVEKLQQMLQAAERSALLTSRLLAFSRKQTLQPEPVYLTELIADMGQVIPSLTGEDVAVHMVLCPTRCVVKIDRSQFQQVLLNLVSNARDAMPRGGDLTIAMSRRQLDDAFVKKHGDGKGGVYAAVAVTDTGCGMDEATVGRLFEPFFTTKEPGKGTGLGLAMVYGFVAQSGGMVEVESCRGQGSTFTLFFPEYQGSVKTRKGGGDVWEDLPQGTETILLVEDEEMILRMLVDLLGQSGYTVLHAGNTTAAIAEFERVGGQIDMLITDVVMPGGSGLDLAETIRKTRPQLTVLYVSGYAEKDLQTRGVTIDVGHLLIKPFSHATFLTRVRQLLDERSERIMPPKQGE